jgi:hypothetical protein
MPDNTRTTFVLVSLNKFYAERMSFVWWQLDVIQTTNCYNFVLTIEIDCG